MNTTTPCDTNFYRDCPMATKRNHDSQDDDCIARPLKFHNHRISKSRESSSRSKRKAKLLAELKDLGDYNKPPLLLRSRVGLNQENDDHESTGRPRSPSICDEEATRAGNEPQINEAHITESKPKSLQNKRRNAQDKLLNEIVQLERWPGWVSEEEDNSSDNDVDDHRLPRIHSRYYRPKCPGTQNMPWSEIPAEIRNMIYEQVIVNEEEKNINVVHYPAGVPRRSVRGISSTTAFAHSHWSFTQTCQQIRTEFTPWLLKKRKVRTPLATLNSCVETFHRLGKNDERIGCIRPFWCGAPLAGAGVEILSLLVSDRLNPDFRIDTNTDLEAQESDWDIRHFDELDVFRDMHETFSSWSADTHEGTCIKAIYITSTIKKSEADSGEKEDLDETHDILIKLDLSQVQKSDTLRVTQLQIINSFIFKSKIAEKPGIKILTSFHNEIARWKVRRRDIVDMQRQMAKKKVFARLISAPNTNLSYKEESLE